MTNNKKFFETFGIELREHADLCDLCKCDKRGCLDCPLGGHSFEYDEYKAPTNVFGVYSPSKSFGKDEPVMVDVKQQLLEQLSKEDFTIVATAYSFAENLTMYGVDVTEKWDNVLENTRGIQNAYNKGYFDALTEQANNKYRGERNNKGEWIYEPNCWLRCSRCGNHFSHTSPYKVKGSNYCPNCGAEMESEVAYE